MNSNRKTSLRGLPAKIIFLLFLIISSEAIKANDYSADSAKWIKELKLSTGIWSLSSIDELYSFQRYSGSANFWGISFLMRSPQSIHSIEVNHAMIKRKPHVSANYHNGFESRYSEMESFMADVNYSYMKKLYSGGFDFYVSGNWINSMNQPQNEEAEIDFSSIAPGAMIVYNNSKHSIGAQLSAPLISLTYRHQYHISWTDVDETNSSGLVTENLKIESLRSLFILYTQLNYKYFFSKSFGAEAQYELRYISDKTPRKLTSASGIYSISLIYKF